MTRAQKTIRDSVGLLAAQAAMVGFGVVFLALLTRSFSAVELAAWALLEPMLAVGGTLIALGLTGTLYQRIPSALERGEHGMVRWLVRVTMGSQALLILPVAIAVFALAEPLSVLFLNGPEHRDLIRLLAALMVSGRLYEQEILILSTLDRIHTVSTMRIVHDLALRYLALGVMAFTGDVRAFFALFAGGELVLVVALAVWHRHEWWGPVTRGSLRELVVRSFPFYLNGYLRLATTHADKFAVGILLGPRELAAYFLAHRFFSYVVLFSDSMLAAVLPKLSQVAAYGRERVGHALHRTSRFVFVAVVPVVLHVAILSGVLVEVLGAGRYPEAGPVLLLLCAVPVLHALSGLYGGVVYVTGAPQLTVRLQALGSGIGLPAVFAFGAALGVTGVALARAVTALVMTVAGRLVSRELAPQGADLRFLRRLLLRTLVAAVPLALVLRTSMGLPWIPAALLVSVTLTGVAILRMLSDDDLDALVRAVPVPLSRGRRWLRAVAGRPVGMNA